MLFKLPGLSTMAGLTGGLEASSAAAALHSTKADGMRATPAINKALYGKDSLRMTVPPLANHPGLKRLAGRFRDESRGCSLNYGKNDRVSKAFPLINAGGGRNATAARAFVRQTGG